MRLDYICAMNRKLLLVTGCIVVGSMMMTSCKNDEPEDPVIPNEEELITTVNLTFTPVGGGDQIVFSFQDLDGDGGDDPVIISLPLDTNTEYDASLELLNEVEDPADDITLEIEEEAEDHQFFFVHSLTELDIAYGDADSNGDPVGIVTVISTGDAESGELTIILRHEPDKSADGVAQGDITNAGGETDIEVTFDIDIQ